MLQQRHFRAALSRPQGRGRNFVQPVAPVNAVLDCQLHQRQQGWVSVLRTVLQRLRPARWTDDVVQLRRDLVLCRLGMRK